MGTAKRIFVTGTGTDVGKTHVTCALLHTLRERKMRATAWKPIASGGAQIDTARHAAALGASMPPPLYAFGDPISPHLAAKREGVRIELERVARTLEAMTRDADVVVVEGAGGLFSPFGDGIDNAALARALAPVSVLLVASDRLGVLHDLSATLAAARGANVDVAGVVLSAPEVADASTGTNAAEAAGLGIARIDAVFPRAPIDAPQTIAAATRILAALGQSLDASGGGRP